MAVAYYSDSQPSIFIGIRMMKSEKVIAHTYAVEAVPMEINRSLENLHTTLPMAELINLFETEIGEVVHYDSFEYEHPQHAVHYFKGVPKMHKCHYRLNSAELELGSVTLTRRKPFEEEEMLVVEKALGALSIHLNNAMNFQARLDDDQLTSFKVDAELSRID